MALQDSERPLGIVARLMLFHDMSVEATIIVVPLLYNSEQ